MDACLEAGVHCMDTPPTTNRWMWRSSNTNGSGPVSRSSGRRPDGLLGNGFDPGVTNVGCAAYAKKHLFDGIHVLVSSTATRATTGNLSPRTSAEINIRSDRQGRYWERGEWVKPIRFRGP